MSANIQTYLGRESAWHNLGKVTGQHFTWADCLKDGGLDFDVFKSQLHDGLGRKINAWGTFRYNREDKDRRNKDATIFLGTVGENYQVINHASGFELVDALVQSANGAHYETAGVLGVGEVVWGLADLGLTTRVGDDAHKNYLLFSTGHDGSYSYSFRAVNTRVVCNNTLDVALGEKTKSVFRVRHTLNAKNRVQDAQKALVGLQADIRDVEQKLQFLAGKRVTRESANTLFERLFPITEKDEDGKKVAVSSTRRNNVLAEILSLYEANDGNAFPEQRGSSYALLNAITNWTDHVRGTEDSRSESALFGSGNRLKTLALDALVEQSQTAPDLVRVDFTSLPALEAMTVRR